MHEQVFQVGEVTFRVQVDGPRPASDVEVNFEVSTGDELRELVGALGGPEVFSPSTSGDLLTAYGAARQESADGEVGARLDLYVWCRGDLRTAAPRPQSIAERMLAEMRAEWADGAEAAVAVEHG